MAKGRILSLVMVCVILCGAQWPVEGSTPIPGIMSCWLLDEGEGDIAHDSVGGNHGTLYGATWTIGQVDGALDFDGNGDYVYVEYSPSLDTSADEVTVTAWINTRDINKRQVIASRSISTNNSWLVEINPTNCGAGRLNFVLDVPTNDGQLCGNIGIAPNTWYHAAFVYDGVNRMIYINAQLDASKPDSGNVISANQPLRIGSWTSERYFDGKIDEVVLWDRALSVGEIQQLYQSGLDLGPVIRLSESQLEFHARLDDPSPEDQILSVRNSGTGTLDWQISESCDWLYADPCSGSSTGELDDSVISVDTNGLPEGQYECELTVSDPCAYNTPQTVTVILDVLGSQEYHVDGVDGDDNNDGLSRATAFATVQKGIGTALDGDTVLVWPGVYAEALDFEGKAITLQSAADAAILEAPLEYAVTFRTGEGPNSVLKNFIITNSYIGLFIDEASPTISNLTVVDNNIAAAAFFEAEPDISNCIFWNNTDDLLGCSASYSCIDAGDSGPGNISFDPCFASLTNGDYHLLSEMGRFVPVDPGVFGVEGLWSFDDVTSPCIDGGDPAIDPAGERMPNGGRVNIGAYGGTAYASMSAWPVISDMNFDGVVDVADLAILAGDWTWRAPWIE